MASLLLAPNSDHSGARKPLGTDVEKMVESLAVERGYWAGLDVHFRRLLIELPRDVLVSEGDDVSYGAVQIREWAGALRQTARVALGEIVGSLDASGRTLKAVAQAERYLAGQLKKNLAPYLAKEHAQEANA